MSIENDNKIKFKKKMNQILLELPEFSKDFFIYCSGIKNYSMRTILEYAQDLRVFFRYLAETNPLLHGDIKAISLDFIDELRPQDLYEYIQYIEVYNNDNKTLVNGESGKARKVASLRTFYKYYYSAGMLKNNPSVILNSPKNHKKNIIRLESDEIKHLLNTVENLDGLSTKQLDYARKTRYRDYSIIVLLLGTGIRVSECVNINLDDINWKNRSIRIIRKGGNESIVYFNEDVENALNDYIELERVKFEDQSEPLFLARDGRISVRTVQRLVKKYSQIAVPQKHITPHKMRSTYGTNLYQKTSDIYLVADALGHSTLNVVQRYADISDENRKVAGKLVNWTHSKD